MKSGRNVAWDFIRSIAIFSVVVCHSTELLLPVHTLQTGSEITVFSLGFALGRLGVPLFLFLTGAIVLRKRFSSDEDFKRFYFHNWLFLLAAIVIWAGLSELMHGIIIGDIDLNSS